MDDGLVRHPQGVERAGKARLEAGAIAGVRPSGPEQLERLALGACHRMKAHCLVDRLLEPSLIDRLAQVLERAVVERGDRRLDRRRTSDENDRQVEIFFAHCAQEL